MKGFLSRISINPERRFKRNVRYRKTSRTRQAAGAGKHPPEAAARYIWVERSVYAAVRGDDAGGGCVCSAGADSRMGGFGAMLLRDDAGGYVLVGVVCFAAAVVVTVFCTRLRKNNKQQEQTKEDEET